VLRRDFPISSSVAGWEANNILTFLSFHVLTRQSHSLTMARRKIGVLNNLGILLTTILHDSDSRDVLEDLLMHIIRDWMVDGQLGLTGNTAGTVFSLRCFGMT
jgi:hypothetical protein